MPSFNSIMEENKGKDVLVHISPDYIETELGRYCTVVFKVDGNDRCFGLSTNALLSIIELHFSNAVSLGNK